MTLKEALAFSMPDGKTLGEMSPEEWSALAEEQDAVAEELKALDWSKLTVHERAKWLDQEAQVNDFLDASSVIKEHLSKHNKGGQGG